MLPPKLALYLMNIAKNTVGYSEFRVTSGIKAMSQAELHFDLNYLLLIKVNKFIKKNQKLFSTAKVL